MPKTKIAVLGGGMGALSTAFMLSEQDAYDITVYQLGWRLGGKGASGRNHDLHQRIEEHGVHVWFGFYENAFWLIRQCYDKLGLNWREFFKPQNTITPMDQGPSGWVPWEFHFPPLGGLPGDGGAQHFPTPWEYIRDYILPQMLRTYEGSRHEVRNARTANHLRAAVEKARSLDANARAHADADRDFVVAQMDAFEASLSRDVGRHAAELDAVRRVWIMLRLGAAIVRGMIRDDVIGQGFDCIDHWDATEWLQDNGAHDPSVWWSAPVRAIYDGVFGFERGDPERRNLAAGIALRGALRMFFSYKGAVYWKMQAGMGETVFTPLYKVLCNRGVKFAFFHRVEKLGLSADKKRIDTIDLTVQATVKGGREYRPFVPVKGLDCWPTTPLYDQLDNGDALKNYDLESAWSAGPGGTKVTLRRDRNDFDLVVLAIPVGGLSSVCDDLIKARDVWRDMVQHVQTVQTLGLQLWLRRTTEELGWRSLSPDQALVAGYVEPVDSWADMSHLIEREDWPASAGLRNISYFCGPLPDNVPIPAPGTNPGFPAREKERLAGIVRRFLRTAVRPLWPPATDPDNPAGLDWDLLVAPTGQTGEDRLSAQYWTPNIDPSARYVLSLKGSTPFRLPPGGSGFENLYLAGDWTLNGLNVGCIEAATMSGMQAAQAIARPRAVVGATDFPP
jgi:uncharacterized protein with NAD-binding domain and iron-sulfur cluster